MKKFFSMLIVLSILLGCSAALASDLGVQVIGGSDAESIPVSLDDVQIDSSVDIPGWGEITPTLYRVQDCFLQRKKGVSDEIYAYLTNSGGNIKCSKHYEDQRYTYYSDYEVAHYESKTEADFACLFMDILNNTSKPKNYGKDVTVKAVFDDNIEYQGWFRQRNSDLNLCKWIDPEDNFSIDPYYVGHYVFGCTLPNTVLNSTKPLRIEISIDGNEITYNVRK